MPGDELENSYIRAKRDHKKDRLPPGQRETPAMVAMPPITSDYPHIEKKDWRLKVYGEVAQPQDWNWEEFLKLPSTEYKIDFHCVTHWSKLDQEFTGVALAEIIKVAAPKASAKFVIFECADGYTTNVSLKELQENVAFIAFQMDGQDIPDKFGGPARVVIPHLYAWKSAKFLTTIRFQTEDEPGFWETRGYHNHGDPWQEERYS